MAKKYNPGQTHVRLQAPFVEGIRPTLASMLLGLVNKHSDTELHARYRCVNDLQKLLACPTTHQRESVWPKEHDLEQFID